MKSLFLRAAVFIVAYVSAACWSALVLAQSLYWTEIFPGGGPGGNSAAYATKRSAMDGSDITIIGSTSSGGVSNYYSMAYEPIADQLYGTDPAHGRIQHSNLNGSNIQTVYTSLLSGQPASLRGLAIDPLHSTMYWTDESHATVAKGGLDGSGQTNLVSGIFSNDVVVDVAGARLFFDNNIGGEEGPKDKIDASNLDGSNHHTIVSGIYQLTALDIDPIGQKIYWADVGLNALNDTSIHRANFDGSGAQTLLSNLPDVIIDMDVVPELNLIYWTSRDDGTIKRSALNGSNVQTVVSGLSEPEAILVVVPEPASGLLAGVGFLFWLGCSMRCARLWPRSRAHVRPIDLESLVPAASCDRS